MGAIKTATIQSGIEPVLPGAPTRLAVSNIEAFSVVLQFTPGFDGNSSVTKWTVQVKTERSLETTFVFPFFFLPKSRHLICSCPLGSVIT